ncbi:PREDICTED: disease resistance protein TAO1-like isoform X2 [Tarenaya hassleriana]|uniref:disease resistance protein TAO1-like isoform X2 n=1 Tax=Tarenaya hassleriana TaxID=28532 RepID=UPI00053C9EB0|nr:PREDICTED: disease resistance protein TAO1-like isoform X2 [Tarenaya hassleriana]
MASPGRKLLHSASPMDSPDTKRRKTLTLPSPFPSSSRRWRYDVFPSFRGQDVRSRFLSHVRKEFYRKGIITFDDNGMERSESISNVLVQAIQESRMAIVVLSENYASSSWCLNELLHIMSCKDSAELKVFPIFYDVDPSDVRKQTGEFGRAFEATCVGKSEEEKRRWSQALTDVAGLAGEHSLNWDGEAAMIEKIASVVLKVLNHTPSGDFDDFVGMGCHMENLMQLLCLKSDEVRFVGIWGPAGIVTTLAGDLPLALSILGSSLREESKEEWELALPRLRSTLDGEIEKTLKVGFDSLSHKDRSLFLHIACLFNNEEVGVLSQLFGKSELNLEFGLKVLEERSLIRIDERRVVRMHYLLEEMGKEIIRGESDDPGRRQFVWDAEDVYHVLSENTGTEILSGISLDTWELTNELCISDNTFQRMPNLKFLRFSKSKGDKVKPLNVSEEGLSYLPSKLSLLEWRYYPLKTMPCRFRPQCLVRLKMRRSKLEKLWDGIQPLRSLRHMDLSWSYSLKEIPDLSNAVNLKYLLLGGCKSLVKLPDLSNAVNLETLNLDGCSSLVELSNFSNAVNLETLDLGGCSSLVALCHLSNAKKLRYLFLQGCSSLVELPDLSNAVNVKILNLRGCSSLVKLPDLSNAVSLEALVLKSCTTLVTFATSLRELNKPEGMDMEECTNLEISKNIWPLSVGEVPSSIPQWTYCLTGVRMECCRNLRTFPCFPANLKQLYLSHTGIEEVPSWIHEISSLQILDMSSCEELKIISPNVCHLEHLKELDFSRCKSVTSFPAEIFSARGLRLEDVHHKSLPTCLPERCSASVENLDLSGCDFESIPDYIKHLSRLETLRLDGCENLVSLPELPESLRSLYTSNCKSLERVYGSFSRQGEVLDFTNCLKLSKEAREVIRRADFGEVILPASEIPKDSSPLQAT